MNPAEVVDYVAAALASNITTSSSSSSSSTAGPTSAAAGTALASQTAVTVGDLLTLEAQERLKLRLMDSLFGLCPGPAAPGAAGCVPDVSAVVLLMPGSPALHAVAVDQQKMKQELAGISRWVLNMIERHLHIAGVLPWMGCSCLGLAAAGCDTYTAPQTGHAPCQQGHVQ
jgi:hypothetical protein